MKTIVYVILDHGSLVDELFKELSFKGFNGTILKARSIKHLLEDEEADDIHFLNINHLHKENFIKSTFCYFIVNDNEVADFKDIVRNTTNNFTLIKGAMFTRKIEDYEGSF